MPDQHFKVHVNPDDLARQDLTAVPQSPATGGGAGTGRSYAFRRS